MTCVVVNLPRTKRVSRSVSTPQPLAHTDARSLYAETEAALMKVQSSMQHFVMARWRLGQYFAEQKQACGGQFVQWLAAEWPDVSVTTAYLWISFYKRTPYATLKRARTAVHAPSSLLMALCA